MQGSREKWGVNGSFTPLKRQSQTCTLQLGLANGKDRLLFPYFANDTADSGTEIPTRPARKTSERTAVIDRDIVEIGCVSKIAVDRGEFDVAGGSEMTSGIDHPS